MQKQEYSVLIPDDHVDSKVLTPRTVGNLRQVRPAQTQIPIGR